MRRVLICLVAATLLIGCGNDPTPPPDVGVILAPGALEGSDHPPQGVHLRLPVRWHYVIGEAPQLFVMVSGNGQIAMWRYPRREPLPVTRAQLDATRRSLIAQVHARDPTFDVHSSRLILKPGLRAVEVVGVGTNQGVRRSVRSLHAYGHRGEVVIDAFAPPKDFPRVDAQTFRPVLRSLKLRAPSS